MEEALDLSSDRILNECICGNESGLQFWVVDSGPLALLLPEATSPTVNTIIAFNMSRYWNTM